MPPHPTLSRKGRGNVVTRSGAARNHQIETGGDNITMRLGAPENRILS